jgi:hypothetical protein
MTGSFCGLNLVGGCEPKRFPQDGTPDPEGESGGKERNQAKKQRKDERLMARSPKTGSGQLRRLGEQRSVFSTACIT